MVRRGKDDDPGGSESDDAHFDAIAAELLRVAPDGFTRARQSRAEAESGALAREIRALRKPSVAAWAVNRLSDDATFREALELSASLRAAQDDRDAAELGRLGAQRRALVAALARRATALADDAGVALSTAARDDVERTVNAAILDPVAGAVVAAGRLVRPLDPGALDPEGLRERVAGSIPGTESIASPPRDDLADRRARRDADKRRREAERAAADAQRERARVERQRDAARERSDRAFARVEELRRELEGAVADAEAAGAAADESERAAGAARDAAVAAAREAERSAAAADGLAAADPEGQ